MEDKFSDLRKRAEMFAGNREHDISGLNEEEIRKLIHNLEVHQVELEMQNDELLQTQLQLREAHNKYFDLFEFAPVGYVSTDQSGTILAANTSFAALTGYPKDKIIHTAFSNFVAPEHQDNLFLARQKVIRKVEKQTVELELIVNGEPPEKRWVNLEITTRDRAKTLLIAVSDISRLKATEMALAESERQLKTAQNLANIGSYEANPVTGLWSASDEFCRIFGFEAGIQYPLSEFEAMIHPADRDRVAAKYNQCLRTGQSFDYECRTVNRITGQLLYVRALGRFETNTEGSVIRTVGTLQNITRQKLAEIEQKRQFEFISTFMLTLPIPAFSKDVQGRYLICNQAFYDFVGKPADEVLQKQVHDAWPQKYADIYRAKDMELLQNGGHQRYESIVTNAAGKERHVIFDKAVFYDENRQPAGIIGVFIDITESQEARQSLIDALAKSEQNQREVNELLSATHAILESDDFEQVARRIFEACKRSIGAQAGYVALLSPDGAENDLLFLDDGGLECHVDPHLPMPVRGLRAEAYRTGKVVYDNRFMESEWVKFMPQGHLDLPNVLFAPLNVEGKTVGVLGLSNKNGDFTENDARLAAAFGEYAAIALQNSRTMEQLETRARELQELNATKDRLFSIIGHDLKNPLHSIIGLAALLLERGEPYEVQKLKRYLELIHSSAESVAGLLDSLLMWSRAQRRQIALNQTIINISEIVNQCVSLHRASADTKQIELRNEVVPDTQAFADSEMITTVVRNLISNAVKFTPAGGTITVRAAHSGNELFVSVADTGTGMTTDQLQRLFRVGESQLATGTAGEKGTGLGLLISREFISQNNGRIWAESTINQGSTFHFCIPATTPRQD